MRWVFVALAGLAAPAWAVGSLDEAPAVPGATAEACADGTLWDGAACVEAASESLDDAARYTAARELAHNGRAEAALEVLAAIEVETAETLTLQGFAARKAGRPEAAMGFYERALARDPDHVEARSYMGQALVEMGDMEGARAQLLEIRARTGRDSWAYVSLKQAMAAKGGY